MITESFEHDDDWVLIGGGGLEHRSGLTFLVGMDGRLAKVDRDSVAIWLARLRTPGAPATDPITAVRALWIEGDAFLESWRREVC